LDSVGVGGCPGGYHTLAEGDHVTALNLVEPPGSPFRENMEPQIALVCSRGPLEPASVFLKVAFSERGERSGLCLFALPILFLDRVGPARDLTTEFGGSGPSLLQCYVGVTADSQTRILPAPWVAKAEAPTLHPCGCNSQSESLTPVVSDVGPSLSAR
jgi:hypothetical protein